MKNEKILSVICLLTALVSSTVLFGNTKAIRKNDRIYIKPNEIVCSENGIFIKQGNSFLRTKSIAFDEAGIYIRKMWFGDKEEGEETRGGHDSNKRPSTEINTKRERRVANESKRLRLVEKKRAKDEGKGGEH